MGSLLCAPADGAGTLVSLPLGDDKVENRHMELSSTTMIEYITDVEGNWEYFVRFVEKSKVLYWSGEELGAWGPGTLRLQPHGILVFGGDAPDKGTGDIRIIRILTSLKRRFPSQVYIVLGNRDLMKLRFYAELQDVEAAENIWMPPWDPKAKPFDSYVSEAKITRDLVGKLKWLLHCTMGCQDTTFGTRKHELALLNGRAKDEDVLQSYLTPVDPRSPDPWMLEFLKLGQIGVVLDNTLFVHGGVQDDSIGRVPGKEGVVENVREWVKQLNEWKESEIQAYIANPGFYMKDGVLTRGGAELIQYGTPGAGKSTVIYHNPFQDGNPVLRSEKVQQYLEQSNIRRVISGHQPHGQTPTVVRHPATGLLVITADTSRSDSTASKLFNKADNRGVAVSMVRIQGSAVDIEGQLVDGRPHRCRVHVNQEQDEMPDALVGRQLDDGSWVKTVLAEEGEEGTEQRALLQTALGKGFDVKVEQLTQHSVCMRLRNEFKNFERFKVSLREYKAEQNRSLSGSLQLDDCRDADLAQEATHVRNFSVDRTEFNNAENYLFSLMGVVTEVAPSLRGTVARKINDLIAAGKRVIIITNNSNLSRAGLMEELQAAHGINIMDTKLCRTMSPKFEKDDKIRREKSREIVTQHIVTSANTCAWFLKEKGIKKPFVICSSAALLEELEEFGISSYVATVDAKGKQKPEYLEEITNERICNLIQRAPDVDAVVIGWDQQFSAMKVAVATQYLKWSQENQKPLPVISCSMDPSGILGVTGGDYCKGHKFDQKKIRAVGNGAMTNSITSCIELDEVIDVGKPSKLLLEQLKRPAADGGLGLDFSKTVMVGSTLNTDIELANGGCMKSLLVLSGVTSREEVMRERDPLRIPTWVAESFADV